MTQYDDRTGDRPAEPGRGPLLDGGASTPRLADEQLVVAPSARIPTEQLPEDLYVQLQDDDGRLLFDAEGRPVMVRHLLQKPRTVVSGIYATLAVVIAGVLVNAVLTIIGLVELHHLVHPDF